MSNDYYSSYLYPLQDKVLKLVNDKTPFYLTGGTTLSRMYYHHRYSDDLDFFLNNDLHFLEHAKTIQRILKDNFNSATQINSESFYRFIVTENDVNLKIELINDVAFHFDGFVSNSSFSKVDNKRNILSNKISALSRRASKDIADIIELCKDVDFNWKDIINEALEKDTSVNELDAAFVIENFEIEKLMADVKWVVAPSIQILKHQLHTIATDMAKGANNRLCHEA